jgi:hypothetical protein
MVKFTISNEKVISVLFKLKEKYGLLYYPGIFKEQSWILPKTFRCHLRAKLLVMYGSIGEALEIVYDVLYTL